MVLIQLLLPITAAHPQSGDANALTKTAQELVDAFGGLTAYTRSPAKGVWSSAAGAQDEDDVVMIEVVTERFDRVWWKAYAASLAARFAQDTIHVRSMPVELLDPEAS